MFDVPTYERNHILLKELPEKWLNFYEKGIKE